MKRMQRYAHLVVVLAATMFLIPCVYAQQDVASSKDHPLISRYSGSYILGHEQRDYDEFLLPLGKQVRSPLEPNALVKSQRIEGRFTRIIYVAPAGRSSLEVFRNYESAMTKAGFAKLFSCSGDECGKGFHQVLYPLNRRMTNRGQISEYTFVFPKDQRYLAAKLSRPEGDVYVSLYAVIETSTNFKETQDRPLVLLEITETKAMEGGLVTVDAAAMARDIEKTGHVAIYGVYFDTNKADIKPESQTALQEMGKFLKTDPKLRVHIIGHTDNVGNLPYNLTLSQQRADAVVKALVAQYKISQDRLSAKGIASFSPVASNRTDAGRAKNRRVELVEQ